MEIFGFGCSWKLEGMHIWEWSKPYRVGIQYCLIDSSSLQIPMAVPFKFFTVIKQKINFLDWYIFFQIYVNIGPVRVRDDEEVVNQDQAF